MAEPILYMGKSGAGKSTSLRNLPPEETIILSPNAKSLPFPGASKNYVRGKNLFVNNQLTEGNPEAKNELEKLGVRDFIAQVSLHAPHVKYLVLDDFTHFFSARIFSTSFLSQNSGNGAFAKWNVFGADVFQALFEDAPSLREDLFIIVIHHTEVKEDGTVGFKSPGKLLDNTIDVPSYFTSVLHGVVMKGDSKSKYRIQTNMEAGRQAKTPPGAFTEMYVPNDLLPILQRLTAYRNGEVDIPDNLWD